MTGDSDLARDYRELELRAAQQGAELETLVEQLPVGVVALDPGGRVAWSNTLAAELLGEASDTVVDLVGDALAGEESVVLRTTVPKPRGSSRVVEITAASLAKGKGGGAVVVVTDVTQRDRVERAGAEFVENAAHQLRNPITAIASSIAALDAGAKDDPVERDRFLGHVARESERMGRTVDALLTLAGLQRGAGKPVVELIPLRPLIEEVVAATGFAKSVDPVIACDDEVAIVSHRELFAQALSNVLANAAEHTHSGAVRIRADLDGATVVLDVTDSGSGIADEARLRVFDRFFRASSNGRRGSGLGLPIALAAAIASGAKLALLDQREGEGTTFRFTIPGARLL